MRIAPREHAPLGDYAAEMSMLSLGRHLSARSPLRFGAAVVLGACLLTPGRARADTVIAGDLDFVLPINQPDAIDPGGGFGIRLGHQFHVPLLVLTPEIGFTYAGFAGALTSYRGIAGLRFGVGEIVRPGVFAHAGIGRTSVDVPAGAPDPSHTGFTYDAGAFLDFTLLPFVNIGAHAAYNGQAGNDDMDALQWTAFGGHAALVF
jgi:hypothetical protein